MTLGGNILQKEFETPIYKGRKMMVGSWMIYGVPAGIGIREELHTSIVNENSSFVPHFVQDVPQGLYFGSKNVAFEFKTANHQQAQLREKIYGENGQTLLEGLYNQKEYVERDLDMQEQGVQ